VHADLDGSAGGVLDRVGQRFLDDPIGNLRGCRIDGESISRALVAHRLARRPRLLHQTFDGVETVGTVTAEHPDLGVRLVGGLDDRSQHLVRALGVARCKLPYGTGLYDDRRHAVGDDIVQFTRDPRPLVANSLVGIC
jgi:hypothetical protein